METQPAKRVAQDQTNPSLSLTDVLGGIVRVAFAAIAISGYRRRGSHIAAPLLRCLWTRPRYPNICRCAEALLSRNLLATEVAVVVVAVAAAPLPLGDNTSTCPGY